MTNNEKLIQAGENLKFKRDNFNVEIRVIEEVLRNNNTVLRIVFNLQKSKQRIRISGGNEIFIKNLDVRVLDGTTSMKIVNGEDVEVENYKEDPEEAIRQMIIDTVLRQERESQKQVKIEGNRLVDRTKEEKKKLFYICKS